MGFKELSAVASLTLKSDAMLLNRSRNSRGFGGESPSFVYKGARGGCIGSEGTRMKISELYWAEG